MASALLASRNEPYWGEKNTCLMNPSAPARPARFRPLDDGDEAPSTAGASQNSLNLGRKPAGGINVVRSSDWGAYVAFNFSNCSRGERRELRRKLESELEQVRSFSGGIQSRSKRLAVDSLTPSPERKRLVGEMMKKCGQILSKLMKQKKSVWFNSPVDVVGMGLHDYHQIVKNPMDLGSVRSKVGKGAYASPADFAADVRLTFNNALIYNPQGHEVHKLAGQYLRLFDSLFEPAYAKFQQQLASTGKGEQQQVVSNPIDDRKYVKSSWPSATMSDTAMRSKQTAVPSQPMPSVHAKPSQMKASKPHSQHYTPPKMSKPRAKDLSKRPMSSEEKQKLGVALENLPHDRMDQILQIVSKRNKDTMQNGDYEIEFDIEAIDTETLWELDRFVNNCKKSMGKMRRQDAATAAPSATSNAGDRLHVQVEAPETLVAERSKKLDIADEDVDIGDETLPGRYPSLEIERNVAEASSSSSSSSDSSSDDSDSGSSSDSDSDAQTPAVGLKSSPRG